jgi:DNA-binding PadR family transcriptional regulator
MDEGMRGGGRGGRRRLFDSAELRLVLLKLIGDQPRHGYDLILAIEEQSGGAYAPSPGVVYPTITLLQDMEHISELEAEGTRRRFTITDTGKALLIEKADEVEALFARLAALAEESGASDRSPVRRAMMNLHMALRIRMARGEANADLAHDVAAILDDAARRIERL